MSNIPTMSWGEAWSFYRRSPVTTQQEILRQLDLPDLMAYASVKAKKEILEEAPVEIRKEFEPKPDNWWAGTKWEKMIRKGWR